MASPNISELATVAIESRRRKLADNITDNTALLNRLKMRGKASPISGGRTIYEELEYDENETYKRFSGYEVLDIQPSDVFSAAEFDLRQLAVAITISGREQLQNAGKERMIPLLARRVTNAEKTMTNGMSGDLYSDGEADSGKQIDGMEAMLTSNNAAGIYGGINRASYEFWRHNNPAGSQAAGSIANNTIRQFLMSAFIATCRNNEKPDLVVCGNDFYQGYWSELQDQQRFTNPNMGKMGFMNLKFMNCDVVLDGGFVAGGNDRRNLSGMLAYMLNTMYVYWRPHKDRNMTVSRDRYATNQDAMVRFILWAGNLTCSNVALQSRLMAVA